MPKNFTSVAKKVSMADFLIPLRTEPLTYYFNFMKQENSKAHKSDNPKSLFVEDLLKVKIRNGHKYYYMSRYLIAKVLRCCCVPAHQANQLAKQLKRRLVQQKIHELTDDQLIDRVESQLQNKGKTNFKQMKPLILIIKGEDQLAKQTASYVAESFNIPNILSMRIIKSILGQDQIQSKIFRRACSFDIQKAYSQGKPIIIQGNTDLDLREFIKQVEIVNLVEQLDAYERGQKNIYQIYGDILTQSFQLQAFEGRSLKKEGELVLSVLVGPSKYFSRDELQRGVLVPGTQGEQVGRVVHQIACGIINLKQL